MLYALAMIAAAAAGTPTYPVALNITHAGRVVGTPQVTVGAGKEAVVEADRPDGYSVRLLVTPVPDSAPAVARIDSTVSFKRNGGWVVVASPVMTLRLGSTATFTGGADQPGGPVTISYRIDPPR